MSDKKTRLKSQKRITAIILSTAALVMLFASFFIRNIETQKLVRVMGYTFIIATILFSLFKGEFGYKPTRVEIEEKMFTDKEPGEK